MVEIGCTTIGKTFPTWIPEDPRPGGVGVRVFVCVGQQKGLLSMTALHEFLIVLLLLLLKIQ